MSTPKVRFGTCIPNPRDPLTMRYARTLDETRRNRYDCSEGHIDKPKPKPFHCGPPMAGAPSGAEAELQRVLLKKEQPHIGFFAFGFFALCEFLIDMLFGHLHDEEPIGPCGVSRVTYPSDYQRPQ